jgi:hypothetical protein
MSMVCVHEKTCTRCKLKKPLDSFGIQRVNGVKNYRKPHCKACDVDRARQYRLTPAGKEMRVREYRKRFGSVLNLYRLIKEQQHCMLCPESDPVCIDFHHLDRARKEQALVDALRCDEGRALANVPESPASGEELRQRVLNKLPGNERRILAALIDAYPEALTNGECAQRANYSETSTSYTNPRGTLRTKGLIEYPESGSVVARSILFPDLVST